jgi:GT2 family glycosyltransferase
MAGLIKAKATICIVNYKTPDFTKLCLRSIRKFTDYPYEVIVVDNGSNDESLDN